MMRFVSAVAGLAAVAALAQILPASASPAPQAVVELFTSQGCSSCPPADAALAALARRPDVIALTLPVDYWDYLGWRDTLAKPAFGARQRAYAIARGDRQIYTPQMVINGTASCIGSDPAQLERSMSRVRDGPRALPVPVSVTEKGSTVLIDVAGQPGTAAPAEIWLLPVAREREVAIERGENGGRTITYANVVRGLTRIGTWHGEASRFEVPAQTARAGQADGYVVLLQASIGGRPGAILGAARSPDL